MTVDKALVSCFRVHRAQNRLRDRLEVVSHMNTVVCYGEKKMVNVDKELLSLIFPTLLLK